VAKKSNDLQSAAYAEVQVRQLIAAEICGRPRGYMRRFQMCRVCFRKLANEGQIPGVTKASW
jgi:small subunit ribosomal protein S14